MTVWPSSKGAMPTVAEVAPLLGACTRPGLGDEERPPVHVAHVRLSY
jgi:hypothetical protein